MRAVEEHPPLLAVYRFQPRSPPSHGKILIPLGARPTDFKVVTAVEATYMGEVSRCREEQKPGLMLRLLGLQEPDLSRRREELKGCL